MKKIIHHLQINASPDAVFDAVATGKGLSSWWSREVDAEEWQDGSVHFTFIADFNPKMKITAFDRPKLVRWRCVAGHEAWVDNDFAFAIEATDTGASLHFTQDYARELSDEQYGTYNFNWGYYLESLRLYCEEGRGKPFNPATGKSG